MRRAMLRKMLFKFRHQLPAIFLFFVSVNALGQLQFHVLDENVIELRLKGFSGNNAKREEIIKDLFTKSGCADGISEQTLNRHMPPNVICVLPGETEEEIVVGAHTDHVEHGEGVVDNWSGAALLPSLYSSLAGNPRQHTFVFIGFSAEERGMLGSDFYVHHLSKEQRTRIEGMVNMDSLGLGPTKVWATHADKVMLNVLMAAANAMNVPIAAVNVDRVGTTDSESFARFRIPRITLHSITQQTWPVLHSYRDNFGAIKMDDYYASYRLIAGYLAYLDEELGRQPDAPARNGPNSGQVQK